jgi:hypothetical protein
MDFIMLAKLLQEPGQQQQDTEDDDDLGNLSLYSVHLDYNVVHEFIDQLSRWKKIKLYYCEGNYVHLLIANICNHDNNNIQRLSVFGGQLDPSIVLSLGEGLELTPLGLKELSLTGNMSTDMLQVLWQGINVGTTIC